VPLSKVKLQKGTVSMSSSLLSRPRKMSSISAEAQEGMQTCRSPTLSERGPGWRSSTSTARVGYDKNVSSGRKESKNLSDEHNGT